MRTFVAVVLLMLAGCGGGGTPTPAPSPIPTNSAPILTSPLAVSVNENTSGPFYHATATDADGDPIVFSLPSFDPNPNVNGFHLLPNGDLQFKGPPNFEELVPAGGASFTYDVNIVLSDGKAQTNATIKVTLVNQPDQFAYERVPGSYPNATYVAPVPGQSRIFIVESSGEVRLVDPTTGSASLYLTVGNIATRGLKTIAPAPDYATSGFLYAVVLNASGALEIRRYGRLNATTGDAAGMQVVLRIPAKIGSGGTPEDIAGWIGFGPDGFLYATTTVGTPTSASSSPISADLTSLLGKVLRIDVSRDGFPADDARNYAIPVANPFAGSTTRAPEIFAYGFVQPFRASFYGSYLIVGDTNSASGAYQRVLILGPDGGGSNYARGARSAALEVTGHFIFNTFITGGYVFQTPNTPLFGNYVFSTSATHFFYGTDHVAFDRLLNGPTVQEGVELLSGPNGSIDTVYIGANVRYIDSFGEDADHNVYAVVPPYVAKMAWH